MGMMESMIQGLLYVQGGYRGELDQMGRIVAMIAGKPDHPPVFAQIHDHAMYLAGVPAKKFYYDPDGYSRDTYTYDRWTLIRDFKENKHFREVHNALNQLIGYLESQSR